MPAGLRWGDLRDILVSDTVAARISQLAVPRLAVCVCRVPLRS